MERRADAILTFFVVLAVAAGLSLICAVPDLHDLAVRYEAVSDEERSVWGGSVLALLRDDSQMLELSENDDMLAMHQLRLELPASVEAASLSYASDPMRRTFTITIPGISATYFYDFPMVGRADHIVDLFFDYHEGSGTVVLEMDGIFELSSIADGRYVYLDFPTPRELYDYIVVLDAGHGGRDVGAYKDEIAEKDLDLQIVLKMKEILTQDGENIGVYYTRTDDTNPSLQDRAALANEVGADLFLSVHNNSTASGRMSGIHGTEVMYYVADKTEGSKKFAECVLDHLLDDLGSESKGLVAGDAIYIIRTAQMPVALAEIGFMTNKEELALLSSDEYQQKAAQAMVDAIYETLGIDD
ncbi:MAG: N-acetylmuramoyl-L-alanine amidase [Lachnospiraceae bacterium]|nr:N-acetylmuramoyl-L-alanine amidase [Lachnospiraceae bacterium]